MIRSNQQVYTTPQLEVLNEGMRESIYSATLEILQRTGIRIERDEALSLLENAGAHIEGDRAFIPQFLVEEALSTAPSKILIYNRTGEPAMRLEPGYYYFGTGSDCPNVLDPETGEMRQFTRKDIGDAATVIDALPNIDFAMSLGLIWDKPVHVTDLYQFQEMLFNTTKPIIYTSHDLRGNKDIVQMASVVAGSEDAFVQHPFAIHYIEPSSPLRASKEAVDKLLYCSEKDIPFIYTPCPSGGATSPVTMAGTLAQTLAESLSGLVVSQLKRRGAPMIMGGVLTVMDMKTTAYLYGGPEFQLMEAALAEMARFLGLPVFGTAGCSEAKTLDQQAAIEATLSITMQMMSGANLIHDVGYLGSGLIGSCDMLVMCDELIGMSKRFMKGIDVAPEQLAKDVVRKVGPKGNFLGEPHTVRNFKTEHWRPTLLDRRGYENWSADGSSSMGERVNAKTKRILGEHSAPPVDEEKKQQVMELIASEEKGRQVDY